MKTAMVTTLIGLFLSLNASAATYYIYEAWEDSDTELSASFGPVAPAQLSFEGKYEMPDGSITTKYVYVVIVTPAQHAAGWAALPAAVKTAAKAAALEERKDFDAKVEKILKAAFLVVLDAHNLTREKIRQHTPETTATFPDVTPAQFKTAVKNKYGTLP